MKFDLPVAENVRNVILFRHAGCAFRNFGVEKTCRMFYNFVVNFI